MGSIRRQASKFAVLVSTIRRSSLQVRCHPEAPSRATTVVQAAIGAAAAAQDDRKKWRRCVKTCYVALHLRNALHHVPPHPPHNRHYDRAPSRNRMRGEPPRDRRDRAEWGDYEEHGVEAEGAGDVAVQEVV